MALILDTDIIIDYLRGKRPAVEFVEGCWSQSFVSAITVGELFKNVRGDEEARKIDSMTSALPVLPVTQEIARQGGLFLKQYANSHGCGLLDCFIAATAHWHGAILISFNIRHFPMLPTARVPYVKS